MLTLGQLKLGVCKRIASTCTTSQTFLNLVNAATRQLMQRGGWFATVQSMRFCLQGNCFVLPSFIESVLAVNVNGHRVDVANQWYDFEPFQPWHRRAAGLGFQFGGDWSDPPTAVSDGMTCVVGQVPPQTTNYLRFAVSHQNDYGKTIYVYGLDMNGQKFISTFPDGTVQEGLPLVLVKPYVQSPLFSRVYRIVKPITAGVVRGYLFDPVSGLMNLLGEFQPNETNPQYVHMALQGWRGGGNTISTLVRLKFVSVYNDNDIVLIDNEDAIRDMIMSIRLKEADNIVDSMAMEASALRELNHQMESRFPDTQFIARNDTFGETGCVHPRIY